MGEDTRIADSWGEFSAVKALLEICPVRVDEVQRGGAECVGCQRRPIHQIGGSFYDDDLIGTAGDIETKLVQDDANVAKGHSRA